MEKRISEDILSANLYIIKAETEDENTRYSVGFCGVIFRQDENECYVLTAYHAVDSLENSDLIVLAYDDSTYNEYAFAQDKHIGLNDYYERFPVAKVEFYDEKYDLAILSFEPESKLNALAVSNDAPQYGSKVAVISSPSGEERNRITYGKIVSKTPVEFGDEKGKTQYKVIRHSAYENKGSSGSVLLNENCEIVGINLGGGKDLFGNFRFGLAMPSNRINDFISEWDND
jgi:S1-C subfamily serine protease